MKRILFVILFIMIRLCYSNIAFSQDIVSLSLPEVNACIGDTILIPIYTKNFIDVGSFGMKLQFDTVSLHFNSIQNINPSLAGYLSTINKNVLGFAWVSSYLPANNTDGKLMDLSFVYLNGNSELSFINGCEIVKSTNIKPYLLDLKNGSVKESNNNKIEGFVSYDNSASSPLIDAKVFLLKSTGDIYDTIRTDINGKFVFQNLSCGNYLINIKYDYPSKGISPVDVLLINKAFVNMYDIDDDLKREAADVNNDNAINAKDALLISRKFVRIINKFSVGTWLFRNVSVNVKGSDVQCNIRGICFGDVNASYAP